MNEINDNNEEPREADEGARPTDKRPLGYWLRVVDGLLTREFATALEAEGLSRRDWMLLNVLSGDVDAPGLTERFARKGKRLRGLEERGWVEEQGDGSWQLTDLGRSEKERIGGIVDGIRSRVVAALGDDDAYGALTRSLESIARELGGDENAADREEDGFGRFRPRGGFGWRGYSSGFMPDFGHGFGPSHGFGPGHGFGTGHGFGPGHGFGGRPRPFDPDVHDGYGRNRHRGFAPGRPGHPAERFDEPFSGGSHPHDEGGHGRHPHAGHGHGHRDHEGHEHFGGHGHGHGGRGHRRHGEHGGRRAQEAYERGFEAGFARGRESGAA